MSLPIWQRTITTESGDIVPGAEVEVVNEATGLPADIFSDREGSTERSNPFFATSNGFAQFYAAPGEYRITATGPSGSQTWRWNVLPGTAATMANESGGSTLGTAATANKQTSPTDTTAGALMAVGAGGINGLDLPDYSADQVEAGTGTGSGFFRYPSSERPFNFGTSGAGQGIFLNVGNGAAGSMLWGPRITNVNETALYFNTKTGDTWSNPVELYHTGNLQVETSFGIGVVRLMKNASGDDMNANAVVPGSDLQAVILDDGGTWFGSGVTVAGTWKNVGGANTRPGRAREFVRLA